MKGKGNSVQKMANLSSWPWRDDERPIGAAGNDAAFEMRRKG